MDKSSNIETSQRSQINALQKLNTHPLIIKLMEERQIPREKLPELLSVNLKELPDLSQILDLNKAALRIVSAIEEGQIIGVYGDYDVDGTTSCALLYHFFQSIDVPCKLYQPGRFIEGYGLHVSSIEDALRDQVNVLITVDCGITSQEAALKAKSCGIDLIITDHHTDMLENMPDAFAVVNPNRRDEPADSPLRALAGVGVAFALAWEIKKILETNQVPVPGLYPLLQFVAIGTLADLAPLNSMNLKLVRHGLKQIPSTTFPGIRAFLSEDERTFSTLPGEKVSFFIGPLINSKGRMDHPEMSLKLLIAKNSEEAYFCLGHLEEANRQRKITQKVVFDEAKKQVLENIYGEGPLINICYAPHWHEGVVGIVASKLVETFKVPAIVLTNAAEGDLIKGSARSAGDLSIFEALNSASDLYKKFGGHKKAAGLSMVKENLPLFREQMNIFLKQVPHILRTVGDNFDMWIDLESITPDLARELERLGPFGQGHEMPIFRMKNIELASFQLMKDLHVRWNFKSKKTGALMNGVSFNYIGKFAEPTPQEIFQAQHEQELSVQFSLNINRFRGKEFLQLQIDRLFLH